MFLDLVFQIDGKEHAMTIENVFTANPWWMEICESYSKFKKGDSVFIPGVGFGSFRAALKFEGEQDSVVVQLFSVGDYLNLI